MDIVQSDLRIMGVKRRKTRALENYGKEKSAPISGKPRPKLKGSYCPSRSRSYNLFS